MSLHSKIEPAAINIYRDITKCFTCQRFFLLSSIPPPPSPTHTYRVNNKKGNVWITKFSNDVLLTLVLNRVVITNLRPPPKKKIKKLCILMTDFINLIWFVGVGEWYFHLLLPIQWKINYYPTKYKFYTHKKVYNDFNLQN